VLIKAARERDESALHCFALRPPAGAAVRAKEIFTVRLEGFPGLASGGNGRANDQVAP